MLFSSQNSKHPQTPFELAGLAVGRQMKLAELTARTMFEAPFEQMRLMQKIGTMQLQILSPLARFEEEAPKAPAATPAKPVAKPTAKQAAPKTTTKKALVRKAPPKPATLAKAPVRTRRATPAKPAATPTVKAPESAAPIAAAKPANTPKPTTTVAEPATAVKPKAPAKKD